MKSIFQLKLRDASFRGVPFYVSSIKKSFQRRKVVHEYPQKDDHYVEDLGKGVTKYEVTAFLVGDNCVEKAKRLEKALLTEGPGTFVNPWEGNLNVTVFETSSIDYDNSVHRYCSIQISFIDAGQLTNPESSQDKKTYARKIAEALGLSSVSNFIVAYKENPYYQLYQSALNGTILEELGIISNSELAQIFEITDEILELGANATYLLGAGPETFADKVLGALGLARFSTIQTRWSGVVDQLSNIVSNEKLNSATSAKVNEPTILSDIEDASITNQAVVEGLIRGVLISQAIGASTLIGSSVDTEINESEPSDGAVSVSIDELLSTRDNLLTVIDRELENPLISDEMFLNLLDARCATFALFTEKAEGLSRLIYVDLPINEPAVVVAYDYYDDSAREAEIVKRNKVIHSGFCPNELLLLSK